VRAVVTGIGQARHVEFDRVATFVASGRKATKDETENNAAHLSSPGLARMREGSLPAIAAPVKRPSARDALVRAATHWGERAAGQPPMRGSTSPVFKESTSQRREVSNYVVPASVYSARDLQERAYGGLYLRDAGQIDVMNRVGEVWWFFGKDP
jgi:hypothetical protein